MSTESQIAVVQEAVKTNTDLLSRLDQNLEKLTDVTVGLNRMLAVHDEKLDQHERKQDDIFELIERRRQEMNTDIKELHSRITTTTREIGDELNATEKRIMNGLEELKNELKVDQQYHNQKQKTLDERISSLEKWRYMLVGAGIVGGYILTKFLPLIKISLT
jgi:DNA repair exonuclease SbcCD ATPase subunit